MNKFSHYFGMAMKGHFLRRIPKLVNYAKRKLTKPTPVVKYYVPQAVSLGMINRCNLRCKFCGHANEGILDEEKSEMTLDSVRTIFSHPLLKNALIVDLVGGEPLLCNDLTEIIAFLAYNGYLTNVVTNGLLLADKISDLKKAGVTSINVSIYSESINVLRKTLYGINKVFPVQTSYVLTRSQVEKNPQEIMDIVEISKSSGCKFMAFYFFIPCGKNANFNEVITDDLPAYHSLFTQIKNKYNKFVLWRPFVHSSKNEEGRKVFNKNCSDLWKRTSINTKGEISPCCGFTPYCLPNVNIFTSTADEIFNHPDMVELRSNLLNKSIPAPVVCQTCHLLGEAGW
jgi:MoaA/NifB/PqqE/SkfB family radical SAM enzyme